MNLRITNRIDEHFVSSVITKRNLFVNKNDCGRVLLVAGGAGMTGAAVFGSRAAMRSGAGLVYTCTQKSNFAVIQSSVPEAVCIEWTDTSGREYDAVAFGPGMGTSNVTKKILKEILQRNTTALIIDADGLNVLAYSEELRELARNYAGDLILTPHIGEAQRLIRAGDESGINDHMEAAFEICEKYNAIVLLKGAETLVARENEGVEIWQNTTGNPGMATAGSGDVLTGVILAFAGQGLSGWDAVRAGAYLHGRAGDLACKDKGEYGMIASDIAENLPYAIKEIIKN